MMRQIGKAGVAAALLVAFALAGMGCKPPRHPEQIEEITAPRDFDWSMTKDVTVKITVINGAGNVMPDTLVTVGNPEQELVRGNILARGLTDDQGEFERVLRVPARYDALRVQALITGVAHCKRANIEDGKVTVSIQTES